ncbi:hypothetical protein FOPG_15043 [Fusarium oxysporum f. sp. conglutinans race 2 54008]|uniref:Uncharacterized protein n=2 Tax=Fusarium oxysporum TaxID=5507 RepID=X0NDQ8_FUSOX|nr:hypothetical protein FOPG_15043 [Fusarium oxysporum f. sp. conglutinans race 2 54008]EXM30775.1 hypothetical protein FOTG_04658 [Fusarium oxysporum f. sp. vasinfectum 25433]
MKMLAFWVPTGHARGAPWLPVPQVILVDITRSPQ